MKKIFLTQGKFTLVDDEDYDYLNQWKWHVRPGFYAVRTLYDSNTKKCKELAMHRVIMNTPEGMETDHIDGEGLNNQKYNLRNCTRLQNICNQKIHTCKKSSSYRGVLWNGKRKWRVQIQYKGIVYHLGYFNTEEEAAKVWDRKAIELFGEFARLNFPKKVLIRGSYAQTN